jgi:hypothetical protein
MYTHMTIGVVASDLAAIINHGAEQAERAENITRQATAVRAEWDDAVMRLEGFRTTVVSLLGMAVMDEDTQVIAELRRRLGATKPDWQCPECERMVPGAELTCPACTGDDAPQNGRQVPDEQTPDEQTGRFEPVAQQPDPDHFAYWENNHQPSTQDSDHGYGPAHALHNDDPDPITPQVLSDMLSLVGITATPNYIHDTWSTTQWAQAAEWASLHLNASDNDVPVPNRPTFLDDYVSAYTKQEPTHAE